MTVRLIALALILCTLAGFAPVPYGSKILFVGGTDVPGPVQEFAWRVVETHCNYQRYELEQRSFWAYDTRVTKVDGAVAYTIKIISELAWQKSEPPALIEMTIVRDDGLRITALKSTFVGCAASLRAVWPPILRSDDSGESYSSGTM